MKVNTYNPVHNLPGMSAYWS